MRLFLITLFSFFMINGFAQTKVMKYCEVSVMAFSYGKKGQWVMGPRRCLLSVGVIDSLFSLKDTSYVNKLKKVNKFITVPDLLNYMQSIGWSLSESSFIGTSSIDFFFKKEFESSEIAPKN